jgi:hypothetical protein
MTPDELADEVGVSGKTLRAWLRENYPRTDHEYHTRWVLTETQVAAARERFGVRWRRAESREGMVTTTVALPPTDHHRLSEMAEEHRASMAELIRQAVAEWLRRHWRPRGKGKR